MFIHIHIKIKFSNSNLYLVNFFRFCYILMFYYNIIINKYFYNLKYKF